jgi:site-specific DNA-cytosine methylase
MDDPETHELIVHFAGLVAQRAWGTVVLEQVPAFFDSTAWQMVLGRATAAGYLLVGVVKVDVRDCGLYQARNRCIAVLTLQGPPRYDFESCVRALAAAEAAWLPATHSWPAFLVKASLVGLLHVATASALQPTGRRAIWARLAARLPRRGAA